MDWIRISIEIGRDPKTVQLARRCGVSVPAAVGHVVMVLVNLPSHAPDGDLAAVPSEVLEHWAGWNGFDGQLAAAFLALFCDETGVVAAWDRLNGAAIREVEKSRQRKARWRAGRQDDADDEDEPVPSGRFRDASGQGRDMSRGHVGHQRDMSPGQVGHVPGTSAGRPGDMSTVSPVDVDVDVDSTTSQLLLAAARAREKTGGDAVPDPDPGILCRLLTAAANRGITARFGEQPLPLMATHGTTARAIQALADAGVPPDWAAGCIEQLAGELRTDKPPRSLGYFVPATLERWRAEQAHRDAVALTPAATAAGGGAKDPLYFSAVRYAREGDPEWIAYCADKGITWQEAA